MTAKDDRKEKPAEPEELQARLGQARRLLAALDYALGHDLANHLIAIQGMAHLLELEEQDRLQPASQEYLGRLRGSVRRLEMLVAGLRDVCRAGTDVGHPERVFLTEVAREAALEVNQLSPEVGIEYHFPEPGFVLMIARAALRRFLIYWLRALASAGPVAGPLQIEIAGHETAHGPEIWVTDCKRALSAQYLDQVRRFLTGHEVPIPGNDFGLVVVRILLERWGATLRVEPRQDQGSVFKFCLPVQE